MIFLQAIRPIAMDFLSTFFFLAVVSITGKAWLAALVAVGVGVVQIGWMKLTRRPVDLMQWLSVGLVVAAGGATMITHDPRFFMVKPTIIYAVIAGVMMRRGWMVRYVPERARIRMGPQGEALMGRWGYAWAGLMALMAVGNLVIALTLSPVAWAWFLTTFALGSKLVLFAAQYLTIRFHVKRRIIAGEAASMKVKVA